MPQGRITIAAASLAVFGCGVAAPLEVGMKIESVQACVDPVGEIRSVRISVVGARQGIACLEGVRCLALEGPIFPSKIADVQAALPMPTLLFEVVAGRGYQLEAIGYGTDDCSYGRDFSLYRFCGQSLPVKLDGSTSEVKIPATCGSEAISCASLNASLRICQ